MHIMLLSFSSNFYLFISSSLIIGSVGIVALIIGINRKKFSLWFTSIFILLLALIFGVSGIFLGVRQFVSDPDFLSEKKFLPWYDDKNEDTNNNSFIDDLPEDKYTVTAQALLSDENGKTEIVEVFATDKLTRKGVKLDTLYLPKRKPEVEDNFVYLNMKFNRSFRGFVYLNVFDESKTGLSKSIIEIDINDSLALNVAFHLKKDISLSEVSYCTLRTQNY